MFFRKNIREYYIRRMDKSRKEKLSKEIVVMIQPSLYRQFKNKCDKNYVKVSEVIRQLVREYIKKEEG